jgi:hypothetical protein
MKNVRFIFNFTYHRAGCNVKICTKISTKEYHDIRKKYRSAVGTDGECWIRSVPLICDPCRE